MSTLNGTLLELQQLGPLPDEDSEIADGVLERYDELLNALQSPLDIPGATVVARLFPKVSCFGMEWTLVHLLEKSKGWPSIAVDAVTSEHWKAELVGRIERGRAR